MLRSASRTKGTYLQAQYRRLAKRRGRKRALVAVGHTLLVIIYSILKRQTSYAELGADFNNILNHPLKSPDNYDIGVLGNFSMGVNPATLQPTFSSVTRTEARCALSCGLF